MKLFAREISAQSHIIQSCLLQEHPKLTHTPLLQKYHHNQEQQICFVLLPDFLTIFKSRTGYKLFVVLLA